MKTKILSVLLAAMLMLGGSCMAENIEYSWDFNGITGVPEHFSANNTKKLETINDADGCGADAGDTAFAWVPSGVTKGNGKLDASTNGYNIGQDIIGTEYINDTTLVYSVNFKVMNKCMYSYIAAPRFGAEAEAINPIKLEEGVLYLGDEKISDVAVGEWISVGAKYELSSENGMTVTAYLEGEEMLSSSDMSENAKAGIAYFSLLSIGKTSNDEYIAQQNAKARNEIVYYDDLYIGSNESKLEAKLKVSAVSHTMKTPELLTVTFSKAIDDTAFSPDWISVEGKSVTSYAFAEDKKTVTLTLDSGLEVGQTYNIVFNADIKDLYGTTLSAETTVTLSAKVDPGVNRSWNFDNISGLPDGFKYNNKEVPLKNSESGKGGDGNSFGWLTGIGVGVGTGVLDKYSNGVIILSNEYNGGKINDVTIAVDYDFKVDIDYMNAWMLLPMFAGGEISPVEMNANGIYFNGEYLGYAEKGTWHNLGVVYSLSSTEGLKMDIYLDSVKKISGYSLTTSLAKSGISYFRILIHPKTPADLAAQYSRFDQRSEYYYMDNLYIGEDINKASPNQAIAESQPQNGDKDFDPSSPITVKFAHDVDTSTISEITLTDEDGNIIAADCVLAESDTLVITPKNNLYYSTGYKLNIPRDVQSTDGRNMDGAQELSFRTATNYDFEIDGTAIKSTVSVTAEKTAAKDDSQEVTLAAAYKSDNTVTAEQSTSVEAADNVTATFEFDDIDDTNILSAEVKGNENYAVTSVKQKYSITANVTNKSFSTTDVYAAAILKKDGEITEFKIEHADISSSGKIEFEFDDVQSGTTVNIILFDKDFNILSAPWFRNVKVSGIDYSDTKLTAEVTTKNKKINIGGTAAPKNGFVICKIAKNGKSISSANADDYSAIDVFVTDENGNYSFAAPVTDIIGEYEYAVSAYGENTVSGKVKYELGTGNEVKSFNLGGTDCSIDANTVSAVINGDLSGLIATFELSDKAYAEVNGEILESGISRINCGGNVTLKVYSEAGVCREYVIKITSKNSSSGGSGSSGGSSGGGSIKSSVSASVGTSIIPNTEIAEPIGSFADVKKSHWAYNAIEAMAAKKIASGDGTGNFNPDAYVKREEFAKLISAAFGFAKGDGVLNFGDVEENAWYDEYVQILSSNGIVNGVDETNFGIGLNITRQDMAVIILRAVSAKGIELTPVREYVPFADDADIADYAKGAVKTLYEAGIINGRGECFEPNANASRAESLYIIYTVIN